MQNPHDIAIPPLSDLSVPKSPQPALLQVPVVEESNLRSSYLADEADSPYDTTRLHPTPADGLTELPSLPAALIADLKPQIQVPETLLPRQSRSNGFRFTATTPETQDYAKDASWEPQPESDGSTKPKRAKRKASLIDDDVKDANSDGKGKNRAVAIVGERKRRGELQLSHQALQQLFVSTEKVESLTKNRVLELARDAIISLRAEKEDLSSKVQTLQHENTLLKIRLQSAGISANHADFSPLAVNGMPDLMSVLQNDDSNDPLLRPPQ